MSKKPTVKANFRRTPARSTDSKPAEAEVTSTEVGESDAEEAKPEAVAAETVSDAAEPAELPVAEEIAAEAPVETAPETPANEAPLPETGAEVQPEPLAAAEPEIAVDEPAPAKPVRARPAPSKTAAKAEPAPEVEAPASLSPAPVTEVEAPAVEVSAETPLPTEPAAQPRWTTIFAKEFTMSTFPSFDFAAPFQTAFSDLQEKAKAAYEKGQSALGDYSEFTKGNVEALVESGKILAAGLQELTSAYVSEGRSTFETLTAEVKELAAAKSPTDFLKLQNDIAKKHFDGAVAAASKHSEALVKLANEAAQPISNRVTLAVEKVKTAA